MSWKANIAGSMRPFVFNLLAALLLAAIFRGLIAEPQWGAAQLTAAIVAAGLAALIGNFQHLKRFKASATGIEAETREVITQAKTTLRELHELAAAFGSLLVDIIIGAGRWAGPGTAADQDAQKARVIEALRTSGVPSERIAEIEGADRRWVIIDYVNGILNRKTHSRLRPEQLPEWEAFIKTFSGGFDRPAPDKIQEFLERLGLLDARTRELIQDYRYYLEHGRHRRPDEWARRDRWEQ